MIKQHVGQARLDRLRKLHDLECTGYYSYQPTGRTGSLGLPSYEWVEQIGDGDSAAYGDLRPAAALPESATEFLDSDDSLYVFVPYTTGSDYAGSTVELANRRAFLQAFGELDGVHAVYGGYSTFGVVLSLRWLLDPENEPADSILSTIEALEDYPLIDEVALGQVELEGIESAWESWGEYDFKRALRERFGCDLDTGDDAANKPEALRALFDQCAERAGEYWFNEGYGNDMVIRLERVAAKATEDDIAPFAVS